MNALYKNDMWDDLPIGKHSIGCKWVFTIKYKVDGSTERYKARLVTKRYTHTYRIDYQETFPLVTKMNSIRILLSFTANCDQSLQQFDLKNIFLHGNLEKEVFMNVPSGFKGQFRNGKVCKLKKSLYGLKQSLRVQFERFDQSLLGFEDQQCQGNHTLFIKWSHRKRVTILIIYVNGIIITEDAYEKIQNLKGKQPRNLKLKTWKVLDISMALKLHDQNREYMCLKESKFLIFYEKPKCQGVSLRITPTDQNHKLRINLNKVPVDKRKYQMFVSKLIYLSYKARHCIRYQCHESIHAHSLRRSLGSYNEDILISKGYSRYGIVIL